MELFPLVLPSRTPRDENLGNLSRSRRVRGSWEVVEPGWLGGAVRVAPISRGTPLVFDEPGEGWLLVAAETFEVRRARSP